jgi:hypothetical protein
MTDSLNTYFLAAAEIVNIGTDNLTAEDAMKNLVEAIPKILPNINLMPTTGNEIKSIVNSLESKKYMWL